MTVETVETAPVYTDFYAVLATYGGPAVALIAVPEGSYVAFDGDDHDPVQTDCLAPLNDANTDAPDYDICDVPYDYLYRRCAPISEAAARSLFPDHPLFVESHHVPA